MEEGFVHKCGGMCLNKRRDEIMAEKGDNFWVGVLVGVIGAIGTGIAIYCAGEKIDPRRKIRELINQYQFHTTIRKVAADITQNCNAGDSVCEVSAIFNFVSNQIKYMSDPRRNDYFSNPLETLNLRIGDCDCKSILLATLLESIGHETQVALIPGHAFVRVSIKEEDITKLPQSAYYIEDIGKVWVPLESTAEGAYIGWMSEASYNAVVTGNVAFG